MIEDKIHFDEPPGTNGTRDFYFIMREFDRIEHINLAPGQSVSYLDLAYTLPGNQDFSVIILLQEDETKEILQSAEVVLYDR